MGTKADFYVGRGPTAKWVGSVKYDGYTWVEKPKCALMNAKTEKQFLAAVTKLPKTEEYYFIEVKNGWPWPWSDSGTTDYAYFFQDGKVYVSSWDAQCYPPVEYVDGSAQSWFPDMAPQRGRIRGGPTILVGV